MRVSETCGMIECCFCNGKDSRQKQDQVCETHKNLLCDHGQLFLAHCKPCQDKFFYVLLGETESDIEQARRLR